MVSVTGTGRILCLVLSLGLLHIWLGWPITIGAPPHQAQKPRQRSNAYAFLLYDNRGTADYSCMCMVAIQSLRLYDHRTEVAVIRFEGTPRLPLPDSELVVDYPIGKPRNEGSVQWRYTFLKLQMARLPYKRVLFFDCDVLFYNSPVDLFYHIPFDSIAAPVAYWLTSRPLMSGGPLGVVPRPSLFADALDGRLGAKYDGEMDYLIDRFNDTFKVLPVGSCVLVGEYAPNDPAFRMLNIPVERALTVHFVAQWKPSRSLSARLMRLHSADTTIHQIYRRWSSLADAVCVQTP